MPEQPPDESAGAPDGDEPDGGETASSVPTGEEPAGCERGDRPQEEVENREKGDGPSTAAGGEGAPGGRDVVVPLRLYKTVTVFSTLIAVVAILAGFVLLDRGTQRATASPEEVRLPVVALGLALIVGGSAVYAFSTRFRTAGMGKPKDDTDEGSNNG